MIFHFLILGLFLKLTQKIGSGLKPIFETFYKCNIIKIDIRISVFKNVISNLPYFYYIIIIIVIQYVTNVNHLNKQK